MLYRLSITHRDLRGGLLPWQGRRGGWATGGGAAEYGRRLRGGDRWHCWRSTELDAKLEVAVENNGGGIWRQLARLGCNRSSSMAAEEHAGFTDHNDLLCR
jgi:hypothetical protein